MSTRATHSKNKKNEVKKMKLKEAIKNEIIKLTDLEKKCLNAIRNQGSFYEESMEYDHEKKEYVFSKGQFFGWEIYEDEIKGCRGAISSLVKKGVISVDYDDGMGMAAYYINYELEFEENNRWKIKF